MTDVVHYRNPEDAPQRQLEGADMTGVLPSGLNVVRYRNPEDAPDRQNEEPEQLEGQPLEDLTVDELREKARDANLNLHGASTKDEIIKAIDEELAARPSETWTVDDLRKYARDNKISLHGAQTKQEILNALDEDPGDPDSYEDNEPAE